MSRIIGYARVSTTHQKLDMQLDDLKKYGCEKIFIDKVSGAISSRDGFEECKNYLKPGDTLVIWKLDRISRKRIDLYLTFEYLKSQNINVKSLNDAFIDTTTSWGSLIFGFFSNLAEYERDIILDRTSKGREAARARGVKFGKKPLDKNDPRILAVKKMHANKSLPIKDICKAVNVSRSTLYRFLNI